MRRLDDNRSMTTLARRDDGELARGIANWCAHRWPDATHEVVELTRPNSGWSNETVLVATSSRQGAVEQHDRMVVRLPPTVPTWRVYDLGAQAHVQRALASQEIPVPRVIAFEEDPRWLGAPFLVMAHAPGRPGGEVPAFDPWIAEAPADEQRRLHTAFVTMLAAIHRVDWRGAGLDVGLRGGERAIASEIDWWKDYIEWAAGDDDPTPALADAITWCATTAPSAEPPASLCWGDPRIGNVLFGDDRDITAVLDWELATIGAAETDLAWYLALDDLTTFFVNRTVAGFLDRGELISVYENALGRAVCDLAWHEIFALTRSVAINERQARLAVAAGVPYPGVAGERNPVLPYLAQKIDGFSG
jgi:aminoglycoside phosphotransferase (APT) family kinase protein